MPGRGGGGGGGGGESGQVVARTAEEAVPDYGSADQLGEAVYSQDYLLQFYADGIYGTDVTQGHVGDASNGHYGAASRNRNGRGGGGGRGSYGASASYDEHVGNDRRRGKSYRADRQQPRYDDQRQPYPFSSLQSVPQYGSTRRDDECSTKEDPSDEMTDLKDDSETQQSSMPDSPPQRQLPVGRAADQEVDLTNQRGRLVEALCRGAYECMVCCVRIKHEARTWSCGACFNLFHLHCARKWARSPAAAAELPMPADFEAQKDYHRMMGWRCPACQHVAKNIPSE